MPEEHEQTTVLAAEEARKLREECDKRLELLKCLERLEHNSDFKKLFLEEYLKNEPARLVHLLAEQSFTMSDKRDKYLSDVHERMIGVARFSEYMRQVSNLADMARKTLDSLNSAEITQ